MVAVGEGFAGVAGAFCADVSRRPLTADAATAINANKIKNHFLIALPQRVADRAVTCLCAELVIAGLLAVSQFHLDLSLAAVVVLIDRLIGEQILRPQFFRDLFEGLFKLEHVAGEKRLAASLFAELGQKLVALV